MSTKIYVAWRIPLDRLNEFFDLIRPQIYEEAEKTIKRLMSAVNNQQIEEYKKEHTYANNEERIKFRIAIATCEEASKSMRRLPGLDVDFGLNVWIHGIHAYFIPIGEYRDYKLPNYAKDYGYWNNTDQPDDVSDKEWDARKETWEQINLGEGTSSHNARRLYYSIIDLSSKNGDFDFTYEMEQRIIPRKKVEV